MLRNPILYGLVGVAVGLALWLTALLLEAWLRPGVPPLGVSMVTLLSLPFVLGSSFAVIAWRSGDPNRPARTRALPPSPVGASKMDRPPPVPDGLLTATPNPGPSVSLPGGVLAPVNTQNRPRTIVDDGSGGLSVDARIKTLSELVRVLKEHGDRTASESRAKSAHLANLSYALRTPLASIVGYTELLGELAEERAPELAPDLRKVTDNGRQLLLLINNLLDLSKIEVGQLTVVLQDVDMAQVVDEVRVAIMPIANQQGNQFSATVRPGARLVLGDHMRVRQILSNLLLNAFRFTKNGTVSVVVDRATPKRDAWIAIRVKDTGVGMTQDELDRAFDRYAEAADRVAAGHTTNGGLGLAISRQLAEIMGGRLEVESRGKGHGTEFTVILPPARTSEDTIAPRSVIALNERLTGTRLLVVDPEVSGTALQRYLERAGLVVTLVNGAVDAALAVDAERPAIVVLDVGLEGAWNLAEDLVLDGVKVVATSLRDEDVERALRLGVTAFLLRPVERRLVLATLERCLGARQT